MNIHNCFKILLLFFFLTLIPIELSAQQQTWTTKSSDGFIPRVGLFSCVVGDKIYVFGGRSSDEPYITSRNYLQIYDPSLDSWSTPQTTGVFSLRNDATASLVNGKIYIIGGNYNDYNARGFPSDIDVFDPSINIWSIPSTIGKFTVRESHVASVINDKIYIIGGTHYGLGSISQLPGVDLQVFDPSLNTWSTPVVTSKFINRECASSALINGKIYVFGGDSGWAGNFVKPYVMNRLDVFDPSTNSWSTPITTGTFSPRTFFSSEVLNGKIYVIGGEKSAGLTTQVDVFDPSTNVWTSPTTIGTFTERDFLTTNTVNGHIYALGGGNSNREDEDNINEEFTPIFDDVEREILSADIELFPNPTNGIIKVHSASMNIFHISVMNILGQSIIDLPNAEACEITLDLSKYERGIYYVKFITANTVIVKRIILI